MRANRSEEFEFPIFPIGPILEAFGGQPVVEGLGWKPYRCPFHPDSDASGSVNTSEQVYNCHASNCPKGNAVQVLMQWERLNYREAVGRAEALAGGVDPEVRGTRGRSSRLARKSGDRSGVRTFRRTWSGD